MPSADGGSGSDGPAADVSGGVSDDEIGIKKVKVIRKSFPPGLYVKLPETWIGRVCHFS